LTEYKKMIFISFVKYTSFADHVTAMKNKNISFDIIVVDQLKSAKLPRKDVIVIDMSKFRVTAVADNSLRLEREKFILELIRKNKRNYTTLAIDEAQIIFPAGKRQSDQNILIDHIATSRNEGFRIILATQRPQSVSPQIVGLMRAFVILRLTDRLAIKTITESLENFGYYDFLKDNQSLIDRGASKVYVFS